MQSGLDSATTRFNRSSVTIGTPVPLFTWQKPPAGRSGLQFHLSPVDGRFLMTKPTETRTGGPTTVSLVTNWTALVDRRTGNEH